MCQASTELHPTFPFTFTMSASASINTVVETETTSQSNTNNLNPAVINIINNWYNGCFWCGRPSYYDCLCELEYSSDYEDFRRDRERENDYWLYESTLIEGPYTDENGFDVRDYSLGAIHTADWRHLLWDKFAQDEQGGNTYVKINWNMFEINQYSLDSKHSNQRLDAIYENLNILANNSLSTDDDMDYSIYYVDKCRYLTFIRWLILSPHLGFLASQEDMTQFNQKLYTLFDRAEWLLDTIYYWEEQHPGQLSIPNPYASTLGELDCRDECIDVITDFIKLCKSILIIQRWMRANAYKRKTIRRVSAFNTLRSEKLKVNINLDCIQYILACC